MKKITLTLLMAISLFSFSQLSGTYTIGGAYPDYATINLALNALNNQGVSGPVVFNIRSNTYNEQIDYGIISGSSSTNTITFQSETQNSDDVIISYNATDASDNFVLKISGTYVNFNNLTFKSTNSTGYSKVIDIVAGSSDIQIIDNKLIGVSQDYAEIYSARCFSALGNIYSYNLVVSGNYFNGTNYYYCYISGFTNINFSNNSFEDNYYDPLNNTLRISGGDGSILISENVFNSNVYFSNVDSISITRNKFMNNSRVDLIDISSNSTNQSLVANNKFEFSKLSLDNCSNINLYHNTITNNYWTLYITSDCSSLNINNNNFILDATNNNYSCITIEDFASINNMDYNNIYSNQHLASNAWGGGVYYTTFSDWQTASGFDQNSYNENVNFVDLFNNLTLCETNLYLTGIGGLVNNDYSGDLRDATNPTIGAEERTNYISLLDLGTDQTKCSEESIDISAGTFSSYEWNTGETNQTISVYNEGTYIITVTDETSCYFTDTVKVSNYYNFDLGNDTSLCDNTPLTLSAGTFQSYMWSTGSTDESILVTETNEYSIEVTDANSCTYHDTINVTMNPSPTVYLGNDTTICDGEYLEVSAGAGGTYLWNTGETDQIILVYTAGTYSVEYTNVYNCSAYDTINVDVVICSGINELDETYNISVYPNPAQNQITINRENININKIDILDITGKIVKQLSVNNEQLTIDISDLQNGVYFLKINDTETLKFIKN